LVKKKTNRKLAKEMCTWINGTTNSTNVNSKLERENDRDTMVSGYRQKKMTKSSNIEDISSDIPNSPQISIFNLFNANLRRWKFQVYEIVKRLLNELVLLLNICLNRR